MLKALVALLCLIGCLLLFGCGAATRHGTSSMPSALLPTPLPIPPPADGTIHVGFLVVNGVYNSELVAPFDTFHHTRFHAKPGMRVFTVGRTLSPVTTFEGLRLLPDYDLDSAPHIDLLVVPSAKHSMDSDLVDRDLIAWVRERGKTASYVLSLCDGAFVLAQAGLLANHACTTFPADIPAFRRRFPKLRVVEDVSFVADGKCITGAGGARSYDPAMFLVEKLYGKKAAAGVGRGMVIDWQLDAIPHAASDGPSIPDAHPTDTIRSYLPGDAIAKDVTVETADGKPVTLAEIVAKKPSKGIALYIVAGAEGGDTRKRGGLWCEDSFSDLPLLRHLRLDYESKGIRFIAVLCPPVYHEERFAYDKGAFLTRGPKDPIYRRNREKFVRRSLRLQSEDVLPFDEIYFDPHYRLLSNPERGEATRATGPRPSWQGKFKWYRDTQTYGTPTLWILDPKLRVFGTPFFMNVYESKGRKLRYTARDVGSRLDRLLATSAKSR